MRARLSGNEENSRPWKRRGPGWFDHPPNRSARKLTEPHHLRPLRLLRDISSSAPAFLSVMLIIMLASASCGYRLAGAKTNNGAGRTIAVPTFANGTTAYRVEQRVSDSVRREFVRRTQFKVVPAESGDVVVSGEVVDYVASPILFNEQGRASSYNISIGLKVVVTDTQSGAVL